MPIQLNLWALMLTRWLTRSRQSNALTTVVIGDEPTLPKRRKARRVHAPPPGDIRLLSAHMRRDIGLELDRA